jgi:hypothetical protein
MHFSASNLPGHLSRVVAPHPAARYSRPCDSALNSTEPVGRKGAEVIELVIRELLPNPFSFACRFDLATASTKLDMNIYVRLSKKRKMHRRRVIVIYQTICHQRKDMFIAAHMGEKSDS